MKRDRIFHYVPHWQAADWLALGWIIVQPNCRSGFDDYCSTMEWLCDCPMVRPR
jgi:hypothetical protein